jgi:hypothetical protein
MGVLQPRRTMTPHVVKFDLPRLVGVACGGDYSLHRWLVIGLRVIESGRDDARPGPPEEQEVRACCQVIVVTLMVQA